MLSRFFNALSSKSRRLKTLILLSFDGVLIFVSWFASTLELWSETRAQPQITFFVGLCITAISIYGYALFGLYSQSIRYLSSSILRPLLLGSMCSLVAFVSIKLLVFDEISGNALVTFGALISFSILVSRFIAQTLFQSTSFVGRATERVAIFGSNQNGRQLLRTIKEINEFKPIVIIDDEHDLQGVSVLGLRVIDIEQFIQKHTKLAVSMVLVSGDHENKQQILDMIDRLKHIDVAIKVVPSFSSILKNSPSELLIRDLRIEDVIRRTLVPPSDSLMSQNVKHRVILVTGAGGSIGSEICRQLLEHSPKKVILLEVSEYALYKIDQELRSSFNVLHDSELFVPIICSVQDKKSVEEVINKYGVDTIFHAAAYKHVPLVEANKIAAINNNVLGTKVVAEAALKHDVKNFILVSTDKAIRPTNYMGASKHVAELICKLLDQGQNKTKFTVVRFGNVVGSSGSVIPLFTRQIRQGGPITVTHKDISRYFMTIPEAAQLVIQASALSEGNNVLVLDMGEPIKILDLAISMCRLSGFEPIVDTPDTKRLPSLKPHQIQISITGLRPGEKLFEELSIEGPLLRTGHPRILVSVERKLESSKIEPLVHKLLNAAKESDEVEVTNILRRLPIDFNGNIQNTNTGI